jgi:hypothetical protein
VSSNTASEQLRAEIRQRLHASGFGAFSGFEVRVTPSAVVLEGRVGSYYQKQVIQAAALAVVRGLPLSNRIAVDSRPACSQAGRVDWDDSAAYPSA